MAQNFGQPSDFRVNRVVLSFRALSTCEQVRTGAHVEANECHVGDSKGVFGINLQGVGFLLGNFLVQLYLLTCFRR